MSQVDSQRPDQSHTTDASLRDTLAVLHRRRHWILLSVAVCVGLAQLHNHTAPPVYQATALVMLQPRQPNITNFEGASPAEQTSSDYYNSQYKLVQSRSVLRAAARRVGIAEDPSSQFHNAGRLVESVSGNLEVAPERGSQLMRVSFRSQKPEEAKAMATAIVEEYIALDEKRRAQTSNLALGWLTETLPELRRQLDRAERDLLQFQQETGILALGDRLQAINERIARLTRELDQATLRRIELQTRDAQLHGDETVQLMVAPDGAIGRVLSELRAQHTRVSLLLIEKARQLGKGHPDVQAIQAQLRALEQEMGEQVQQGRQDMKREYQTALLQEQEIRKLLQDVQEQASDFSRQAVQFEKRRRAVQKVEQLYDPLVQRLREVELTADMASDHIHVIDPPELPTRPVSPRKTRNLAFAVLLGLALGAGVAFLLDLLDDSVKSPDELERVFGTPVMALVPNYDLSKEGGGEDEVLPEAVTLHAPRSVTAERLRALRTSILLRERERTEPGRGWSLLITSAEKGEGKSTISLNLAVVTAQAGKRVLLADTDLRKPSLHEYFNVSGKVGISEVVLGSATLDEAVQETVVPNLWILPCGGQLGQPSELLGSEAFLRTVEDMRERFDCIIFDSSPVIAVTDALLLARVADDVLQVVRAQKSQYRIVRRALAMLQQVNASMAGMVLNRLPTGLHRYYGGRHHYYYYGGRGESYGRPQLPENATSTTPS